MIMDDGEILFPPPSTSPPIELTLRSSKDEGPVEKLSLPRRVIMKVGLPTLPEVKTLSEVATMRFVKHRAGIPAPRVYMYNAATTSNNELGYEWILMEYMPGRPFAYREAERKLKDDTRNLVAKRLAEWMDKLSRVHFDKIGSLYMPSTPADDGTVVISDADNINVPHPVVGQLVDRCYAGDWRLEYEFPKGPFSNLHDYMLSFAQVIEQEVQDPRQVVRANLRRLRWNDFEGRADGVKLMDYPSDIHGAGSQEDKNVAEKSLDKETNEARDDRLASVVANKAEVKKLLDRHVLKRWTGAKDKDDAQDGSPVTLRQLIADSHVSFEVSRHRYGNFARRRDTIRKLIEVIRSRGSKAALPPTILRHWDLHGRNILIDKSTGEPTAVLDWECLSVIPMSMFKTDLPLVLEEDDDRDLPPVTDTEGRQWAIDDRKSRVMMRDTFRKRLDELKSPYLAVWGEEWKSRIQEGDTLARRILHRVQSYWMDDDAADYLDEDNDTQLDLSGGGDW
ncbi:hypothetical protein GGR53DRAFT_497612 [Hypoxylon sp. FL1150]|nr:hypothetical protein GGR53DRAFT_497612 [Hypoxylon sp. FL1150]